MDHKNDPDTNGEEIKVEKSVDAAEAKQEKTVLSVFSAKKLIKAFSKSRGDSQERETESGTEEEVKDEDKGPHRKEKVNLFKALHIEKLKKELFQNRGV